MVNRISIRPFLFGTFAVLLAYLGQRALRSDAFFDGTLLYGSAVLLFLVALWGKRFFPETAFALPHAPLPSWRTWRVVLGALLSGAALLLAIASLRTFDALEPYTAGAWRDHLASVLLLMAAAAILDSGESPHQSRERKRALRVDWPTWGILASILALAAFFRLFRFDVLPFGTWYDEAEVGLQAQRILQDGQFRPVFEGAINGPAHYLYLVAASFDLFGVSTQAIRAVNVAFGLATVLAGYLVGRELLGRRSGLVLAFLLAVSSWSVTLSRFGMHSTSTTPFFTLITLAFVLRALRRGKLIEFAAAGLWLGLGLCFYTSFRLFLPVIGLFLVYAVIAQWWQTRRAPPKRLWLGLLLLVLATLFVVAPVAWYADRHPDIFWARVQDTFVFTGKTAAERWPALWKNVRDHVLMFNWHGDPNGRHNLPGAPMLDNISAALMVLGLAYSLRRVSEPRYALLPIWLGVSLLGGILSLDFEAPQSLRANGALPAAYVLAVVPLAVLGRAWRVSNGRHYPQWVTWPLVGLLTLVGFANFNTYFGLQANDFAVWSAYSAPETLTADLLNNLDDNTDAFVTSFYHNHPTLRFLMPGDHPYRRLETTDQLPLDFAPGRGALLIMNPDSHDLYDAARRYYPSAQYTEVHSPMPGPPVLYTVRLSPGDIASVQGLDGHYFANNHWAGTPVLVKRDPALAFDWSQDPPLPSPFSVEWDGVLHVGDYGVYDFFWENPGRTELYIGEQVVLTGTGALSASLTLAEGNHALRVRYASAAVAAAPGRLDWRWRPPDRPTEPIGPSALYAPPVTANGLLARYYPNDHWASPQALERIEDQLGYYVHVPPLARPYTVAYTGKIAIPETGEYRFGLESIDDSALDIDGQPVAHSEEPNAYVEGGLTLEAGMHDIRVRFADRTSHTHLNVFWMPPGGSRQIIPADVLFPPQGSYARVTLPALASVAQQAAPQQGPAPPAPQLPGRADLFATGLQRPRGIAVADDGRVYVAEGEGGKVVILSSAGVELGLIPRGAETFGEPSDVALDDTGVFVLDAVAGHLNHYTVDGAPIARLPIDPADVNRARGVAVGPDGRLWIAATPGGQVIAAAPDGKLTKIPVWPGEVAQPVDVVVGDGGRIFVTDAGRSRLVRFSPGGQRERSWNLPAANTLDSPHLAVDAAGMLYLTEPEAGRVIKLDATGEAIGAWDLSELLGRSVKAVGLAVGQDGRVWVTDSEGGNVVVITPE